MSPFIAFLVFIFSASVSIGQENIRLQNGLVNISDVDPSIIINLKYNQNDNIAGRKLVDREQENAYMSLEVAYALREVQQDLAMYGYSLVIYDAYNAHDTYKQLKKICYEYRPERAKIYHPNLTGEDLKNSGYIKIKYAHARASTVDVSLISLKKKIIKPGVKQIRSFANHHDIAYIYDGTIDMGTSHDTLDPLSEHGNNLIEKEARENRELLRKIMEDHGFIAHEKFWWQYTLAREPYADSKFNFEL